MDQLLEYTLRILPGLAVALLALLPRTQAGARLCVHLGLFVFVRDAMTPIGSWQISDQPVFWLRFTRDPIVLTGLTLGSASLALSAFALERTLAPRVVWWRGPRPRAVLAGVIGAVAIAAPVLLVSLGTPAHARRGSLAPAELAPLFVFALVGNAYEELVFRGFLQGLLAEHSGEARAAWISGLGFAFGHVSLATVVTNIGAPILLFTAFEGVICAQLCRREGLIAAVLAHGGGIFLIASGL